jgi:hypothetical protein
MLFWMVFLSLQFLENLVMHEVGSTIWYLTGSVVCSADVLARMIVENKHEDWAHTEEQKELWMPFGPAGVFYATCHGIVSNRDAYGSKKDLIDALTEEA